MSRTKTPDEKYMDVLEKLNDIAVGIFLDGVFVGRIVGHYDTRGVVRTGMQWFPEGNNVIYASAMAGGGGYDKVGNCINVMFRDVAEKIEAGFGIKFRNPDGYAHLEKRERIDWENYCKTILKQAGFEVHEILGGL